MKRARAHACTARSSKHRWNVSAPAIATLGRIVCQQIESARDEIDELKLGHSLHAHQSRAASRADDRSFGNRRIDHALFAEVIDQSVSNFERTAVSADVFTNHEHSRVALHLFPDALADCFNHRGHATTRWALELMFFF